MRRYWALSAESWLFLLWAGAPGATVTLPLGTHIPFQDAWPRLWLLYFQLHFPANAPPGRQQAMAQVQGSLAPIWELQPEFWAPDFKPSPVVALTGLWESKPVELPVSVCRCLFPQLSKHQNIFWKTIYMSETKRTKKSGSREGSSAWS